MRALRQRTAALVAAARPVLARPGLPVAGSSVGDLTARLTEVAGSAAATEHLRHGLLAAADSDAGELFDGLELAPRATTKATAGKAQKAAKKSTAAKKVSGVDRSAWTGRRRTRTLAPRAPRQRVRALADAERAHGRAVKAHDRAGADVDRQAAAVAKTQATADEAIAKLDTARAHLEAAETVRDDAAAGVETAESALADAKAAVDSDR